MWNETSKKLKLLFRQRHGFVLCFFVLFCFLFYFFVGVTPLEIVKNGPVGFTEANVPAPGWKVTDYLRRFGGRGEEEGRIDFQG